MGFLGWVSSVFGGGSSSKSSSSTSSSKSSSSSSSTSSSSSKSSSSTSSTSTSKSYGSTNWRNSSAGQAISLGTATTAQKQEAISQGATASQVGLSSSKSSGSSPSIAGATIGGTTAAQKVAEVTGKQTTTYTTPGTSTTQPTISGAVSGITTGKTTTTGTGGSTSTSTATTSNIAASTSTPKWTQTYTNSGSVIDKNKTTETWVSSEGRQVAFAGISASDLSDYYAEKGDLKNAATFAEITAASGGGTNYGSTNWRNTEAGEAISLGTATTEQKLDAMKQGASASNVNLYGTSTLVDTGTSTPTSSVLTNTGTSGITQTAPAIGIGEMIAPEKTTPIINITIPADEPEASGGGSDSTLSEMLSALFYANLNRNNGAGSDGTSDSGTFLESTETTETEETTNDWTQYLLPAAIIGIGIIGAVAIFGGEA